MISALRGLTGPAGAQHDAKPVLDAKPFLDANPLPDAKPVPDANPFASHGRSLWSWLWSPRPRGGPAARAPRDVRVDLIRGIALLIIFINHIPGNPVSDYTPSYFWVSDAADVFVLLAGFAVAMAFGPLFDSRGAVVGTARIGGRLAELYAAHLLVFFFAGGAVAWAALRFDNPLYFETINILPFFAATEQALLGALSLTFLPAYLDILPLYIALLATFPLVALLVRLAPAAALAVSGLVWTLAQVTGINLPNHPGAGVWFFNPFAWQLLFVIGAVAGYAVRDGVRLPRSRLGVWVAGVVTVGCVVVYASLGHVPLMQWAAWLTPHVDFWPSKTNLSSWRVVNTLACAYLVAALVSPRARWLASPPATWLATVGRRSLPVFSLGVVLSIVGMVVLMENERSGLAVAAANILGVALLVAVAHLLDWYDRTVAARPAGDRSAAAPVAIAAAAPVRTAEASALSQAGPR